VAYLAAQVVVLGVVGAVRRGVIAVVMAAPAAGTVDAGDRDPRR
jgi:hypothetical protein